MSIQLMDVYEAAERLGVKHQTIRRLINEGTLQCHRIRRAIRVSQAQLDAYLNREAEPKASPRQSLHAQQPNWNARSMQPKRQKAVG